MHRLSSSRHSFGTVLSAWLAFLAFGSALAVLTPLGEGFDEPDHFAYVQRVAQFRDVPRGHSAFISKEVARFLQIHPVSWALHRAAGAISYESYWKQDPAVRNETDRLVKALRFSGKYEEATEGLKVQYESHQPPLYYALAAPTFAASSHFVSFVDTFLIVRLWSVLIASLTIPGAFLLAKGLFPDLAFAKSVLLLVIVFPGLYPGVVRVANDALAVPLTTWALACLVSFIGTGRHVFLAATTVLLVTGLATKAFFIPLFVGTLLTLLIFGYFREAAKVLAFTTVGLFWYVYNFMSTGSFTGLPETVLSNSSFTSSVRALWMLNWWNLFNVMRGTHIWSGNWSFLGVRTWMYRVVSWFFFFGVAGCLTWRLPRQRRALLVLSLNYLLFLAALVYYATQVFQLNGTSVAEGWYLTSMIPTEAVLFGAGIRSLSPRRWPAIVALFGFLLLAFNVYANLFVMLPYYAGITAHGASGALQAYVPSLNDAGPALERLLRFHVWLSPIVPALLILFFIGFSLWRISVLLITVSEKSARLP